MTASLRVLLERPAGLPMLLLWLSAGGVAAVTLWAGLPAEPALRDEVLYALRLPRLLVAALCGAVLAAGGAALQSLLRNPLAEPALLGVSAGGACAAAIALALFPALGIGVSALAFGLPLVAFAGAVLSVSLVLVVATRDGRMAVAELLLAGMVINLLAGALIGLLTYLAPDARLRGMVFWMLGSFSGLGWRDALPACLAMAAALLALWPVRGHLNLLSMGEIEAGRMGVPVASLKRRIVLVCALGAGAGVAVAGIIGFVGLLVPHFMRGWLGADYRHIVPASMLAGATLMMAADLLSRWLLYPAELPVGLLTTLLGGPLFIWMLARDGVRSA